MAKGQTKEEVIARLPYEWTHNLVNWDKTLSSDSNIYIDLPADAVPPGPTVCGYVSASKSSQVNFQFCMRVPSGSSLEELNASALDLYGVDAEFLIRTAILSFSRSADDKAKPELFDEKEVTEEKFRAMQQRFLEWKPGQRERAAVSPLQKTKKLLSELGDNPILTMALASLEMGLINENQFKQMTGQEAPKKN